MCSKTAVPDKIHKFLAGIFLKKVPVRFTFGRRSTNLPTFRDYIAFTTTFKLNKKMSGKNYFFHFFLYYNNSTA